MYPERGLCARCLVKEIYDGDTLTVEVRIPVRVRLLDCWAPALNEAGGTESRDNLRYLAQGKTASIFIPWEGADRSDDIMSFGRVLAHIKIEGDNKTLSEHQVAAKHATLHKPHWPQSGELDVTNKQTEW